LPSFADYIALERVRVGAAEVDLEFERGRTGIRVHIDDVRGDLEVIVRDRPDGGFPLPDPRRT
jgi:hypothetical protein